MLIMRWFGESDFTPEQCSRRCDVCRNNAASGTLRPEGGWLGLTWVGAVGRQVGNWVGGWVDGYVGGWMGEQLGGSLAELAW
jgi:hypothetical protein